MTPSRQAAAQRHQNPFTFYLSVAYLVLLVYGALFPLSGWDWQAGSLSMFLNISWPKYISTADVIVNILVFMPLGLLWARLLQPRTGTIRAIAIATAGSAALTIGIEYLQMFLPNRVSSLLDMSLNVAGGAAGASLVGIFAKDSAPGRWLLQQRSLLFRPGRLTDLGILVLGLWALSQLTPLVPSLDIGNLRQGISPLWQTLQNPALFSPAKAAVYALNMAGLACILAGLLNNRYGVTRYFFAFAAAVLLLKIPVLSRQLAPEAIVGMAVGVAIAFLFTTAPRNRQLVLGAIVLLGAYAIDELRPGEGISMQLRPFNWIPFSAHVSSLIGIADILTGTWMFLGLAYIAISLRPESRAVAIGGGVLLFMYSFGFEWMQQNIPGRSPDITDAVLAAVAWTLPWLHPELRGLPPASAATRRPSQRPSQRASRSWMLPAGIAVAAIFIFFVLTQNESGQPVEVPLDESKLHVLPPGEQLPPAVLPGFRTTHPRLPSPSAEDLRRLREENPRFLRKAQRRGEKEGSAFNDIILAARITPGSVDLGKLHARLMALEFVSRGHGQAKPLALAYDWLYDQWSEPQRAALRDKLVEAANYLMFVIREKYRLSPYNVYLYNSPLQALMATTIALYQDDPRGDAPMAFMVDYWKHRVLPVWEQIMGTNGGWHEGGEYVAVGIGSAVWQLPAMWRKATGEDMFARYPGIRGFLDFTIFRTRPDGTNFRIGDSAHFTRKAPDRMPLAIETGHVPAYNLFGCPKKTVPTGWPWGPLTDQSLCNKRAREYLKPDRLFDGIGLVVARSDWTPQATYVTFRAGDHYWSHSHLDQGAFTIYRGGALAIDSGIYGPSYGSDHHMNYSMQTIAHNTITVTDPDDTVGAPREEEPPKQFANDGGQRRVGSGWGIESAPLDLDEWTDKQGIYSAGQIHRYFDQDDFVVAVADITDAYTSPLSGTGTFTHRTRRVESLWRSFAWDRLNNTIVVFDRVESTRPEFRKRWLLHTIEEPLLTGNRFTAYISPGKGPAREGGRLDGHVLLPKAAHMKLVGGDGFQYFVNGTNYDEEGKLAGALRKRKAAEPGAWRIEVSPPGDATRDDFLVVMAPGELQPATRPQVRLIEENGRRGCEITGPARTTRWWFEEGAAGPILEVSGPNGRQQRHDLRVIMD